jgi:hypothetical protein
MRIGILGDMHLISPDDPHRHYHRMRQPIFGSVAVIREAIAWLDTLALDAVFSVGDLVDWYGEANVALAADIMSHLRCPWHLTPGNHDFQVPKEASTGYDNHHADAQRATCTEGWRRHAIEIADRRVEVDGWNVLLVDSASSRTSDDSTRWLRAQPHRRTLLLTHVPVDRPLVRTFIHGRDPDRSFSVYVQSGSPGLFADAIEDRIRHVFTGHLHFPGTVQDGGTTFHLLDGSFSRDGRFPAITIVESAGDDLRVSALEMPS